MNGHGFENLAIYCHGEVEILKTVIQMHFAILDPASDAQLRATQDILLRQAQDAETSAVPLLWGFQAIGELNSAPFPSAVDPVHVRHGLLPSTSSSEASVPRGERNQ